MSLFLYLQAIFAGMKVKHLWLMCLMAPLAWAQINEVGGFIGGANYIGDVGNTQYINPRDMAFGVLYRWNQTPRHSFRLSLSMGRVRADDAQSEVPARQLRGYSFKNAITEAAVLFEFNFFEFNLHEEDRKVTPYIASGLAYTNYDRMYFDKGRLRTTGRGNTLALPMIVGVKAHIANEWVLGAEVGVRYTFTDNFDGSHPDGGYDKFKFGNINSNDWYVFSGLTLTYTFGDKPCYCAD